MLKNDLFNQSFSVKRSGDIKAMMPYVQWRLMEPLGHTVDYLKKGGDWKKLQKREVNT